MDLDRCQVILKFGLPSCENIKWYIYVGILVDLFIIINIITVYYLSVVYEFYVTLYIIS